MTLKEKLEEVRNIGNEDNNKFPPGIPATLNYIPLHPSTPSTPKLTPYPDWQSNEVGNCEKGLTTVYRIKADKCDRLWVLDTGTFGIGNTTTNPCPYALNVFDLHTNRRLRRYELKKEDTNQNTFIANIAVDLGHSCEDAFAYMSDELGYGLIVYSWEENKSWRFTHGFFLPDPLKGEFKIGGLEFEWFEEGIFGMSLSPIQDDGYRVMFFSPLASNREFAVSTRILRNSSKVDESYSDFMALEERGPLSHTTSRVMDDYGVQFFNLIDRNAVGCWNMENPYHREFHSVVDKDDESLIFPADVKVDRDRNVWVISDRMPNFLLDKLNPKDVNFRIFFAPVDVLIKGTKCESKGGNSFKGGYEGGYEGYLSSDGYTQEFRGPQTFLLPNKVYQPVSFLQPHLGYQQEAQSYRIGSQSYHQGALKGYQEPKSYQVVPESTSYGVTQAFTSQPGKSSFKIDGFWDAFDLSKVDKNQYKRSG